jgi:hypothetical protein
MPELRVEHQSVERQIRPDAKNDARAIVLPELRD